jgi:hypothetical protein
MNATESFFFTFVHNILIEFGRVAPEFARQQIHSYIMDLKGSPDLFDNLVLAEGDIIVKMSMSYPPILKECLVLGLGAHSNITDLLNWALFCGPTAPSSFTPFTPQARAQALHQILDHKENFLFLSYNLELLNILQYLPTDAALVAKFIDKCPPFPVTNEWLLTFLHRGNSQNIPYIVSNRNYKNILYQEPKFITKMLPLLRSHMDEDESFVGPNESRNQYYSKLSNLQSLIESARPTVVRKNLSLLFWTSILVIRTRAFIQRYYEPPTGKGFLRQAQAWEEHKQSYREV